MDLKQAGSSLDSLISSFNTRIVELQELVVARNMYPTSSMADLAQVDTTLNAMESQIQSIRDRLQEERNATPKAKRIIELSLRQQRKLQHMLAHIPAGMQETLALPDQTPSRVVLEGQDYDLSHEMFKEEPVVLPKVGGSGSLGVYLVVI